jgi:hypothetical protein
MAGFRHEWWFLDDEWRDFAMNAETSAQRFTE